jgi:hypothetical protein
MDTPATPARPRPALFRALGKEEPPALVSVAGSEYHLERVLKHDSWAASAVYVGEAGQLAVKFNRVQPIFGLPVTWLGNWLARREAWMMKALADVPNVARWAGEVRVHGRVVKHAVAHAWIPGHPLRTGEKVGDDFFPALERLLAELHRRGIAYVDLHKRENIIVGEDGQPYLIDFQISQALPDIWVCDNFLTRPLLRLLQRSDSYHLHKHRVHHRPDQVGANEADLERSRPWWIRLHRLVARPFRALRRALLVRLRVRTGDGQATSEVFPEDAVQNELAAADRARERK